MLNTVCTAGKEISDSKLAGLKADRETQSGGIHFGAISSGRVLPDTLPSSLCSGFYKLFFTGQGAKDGYARMGFRRVFSLKKKGG